MFPRLVSFEFFKISGLWFSLFPRLVSFEFFGKLAFLSAAFRTLILWRWKFRELPHSILGQARG
ncbi:hypothetical protein CRN39_12835 [Vibrio vulnificus]|nr:hypothetical protein CRN39_12835 [Vibrio vulnificus]